MNLSYVSNIYSTKVDKIKGLILFKLFVELKYYCKFIFMDSKAFDINQHSKTVNT